MIQFTPKHNLAMGIQRPAANHVRFGNDKPQEPPKAPFMSEDEVALFKGMGIDVNPAQIEAGVKALQAMSEDEFMASMKKTMEQAQREMEADPEFQALAAEQEAAGTGGLGFVEDTSPASIAKIQANATKSLADPQQMANMNTTIREIKEELAAPSTSKDPIADFLAKAGRITGEVLLPVFEEFYNRQEELRTQPEQLATWAQKYCEANVELKERLDVLQQEFDG